MFSGQTQNILSAKYFVFRSESERCVAGSQVRCALVNRTPARRTTHDCTTAGGSDGDLDAWTHPTSNVQHPTRCRGGALEPSRIFEEGPLTEPRASGEEPKSLRRGVKYDGTTCIRASLSLIPSENFKCTLHTAQGLKPQASSLKQGAGCRRQEALRSSAGRAMQDA